MSATQIFVVAIVAAAALAVAAVFAVAARRSKEPGPVVGTVDRRTLKRDLERRKQQLVAARASTAEAEAEAGESEGAVAVLTAPAPDPVLEREQVSVAEFNVTRRQFFNRSLLSLWGIYLGLFALGGLAFLWPKLRGGFGSAINAGKLADLRAESIQGDGTVLPVFVSAAQSWVVPFRGDLTGSSFEGKSVVAGAGAEPGLMALWQKCVHLGCRVPECISSQGFECPCHGSKYNFHGEYDSGPAPRNMDRFVVAEVDGDLIIDTGSVIQTARAQVKTTSYPQGPNCV